MPSSPEELLQLSKELLALGGSETWQRCVVSRAYYASLHATDQTFPKTEDSFRRDGESSHAEIIGRAVRYGKSSNPGRTSASQIAQALPRLRRFRNAADYDLDESLSAREYADVVRRAERILEQCQDVLRLSGSAAIEPTLPVQDVGTAKNADEAAALVSARAFSAKPTLKRVK